MRFQRSDGSTCARKAVVESLAFSIEASHDNTVLEFPFAFSVNPKGRSEQSADIARFVNASAGVGWTLSLIGIYAILVAVLASGSRGERRLTRYGEPCPEPKTSDVV